MPFDLPILCSPLPLFPLIFLSISVLSSELALHIRWPKDWSFIFSISPSSEYSGLISFRIDWFDLLAVQGALSGLLQHHSSKQCSAFFMVQLSHPYMTTGKTIALTSYPCVGAGGPRGATPRSRSGGVSVWRYPSSKVRSSGCTLLEQP